MNIQSKYSTYGRKKPYLKSIVHTFCVEQEDNFWEEFGFGFRSIVFKIENFQFLQVERS